MPLDPEYAKLVPGVGGALLAALIKLKDGIMVTVVQFVMGAIPVTVLSPTLDRFSLMLGVPSELLAFGVGLLSVAIAIKAIETVMLLDFAKPANSFIERWTGAKAPASEEKK